MNKLYKIFLLLIVAGLFGYSCEGIEDSLVDDQLEENPLPTPATYTSGSADFSNYVAVGNSLTAGFMDGALYTAGQSHSIPAILSAQFALAGGAIVNQPNVNSANGFNSALSDVGNGVILGRTELDVSIPGPTPTQGEFPIPAFNGDKSAITNFGVPGIRVADLFSSDLQNNAALGLYYSRFASSPGTSSIMDDATAANPSFFSLWIGNNDVLQYALSGGISETLITSQGDFQTSFGNALGAMVANGSKGVVVNIPPVVILPFFQAISWDRIEVDAATAEQLNTGLAPVNGAIQGCANVGVEQSDIDQRLVSYSAGPNPILVIDEELDDLGVCFDLLQGAGQIDAQQRASLVPYEQSRPLVEDELVLLTAGAVLNTPFGGDATKPIGVVVPLGFNTDGSLTGDKFYLNAAEVTNIVTARATFNAVIDGVISATNGSIGADNVVLVDLHPTLANLFGLDVATATGLALSGDARNPSAADGEFGLSVDGVTLLPDFSPSGIFSTDAVHPNPRGNALIVNEIIKTIEITFGASLPKADVLNYPSIVIAQ
ncbi:MAG: SGNH/GDSL hydrolase family protein [Balneola sp.]